VRLPDSQFGLSLSKTVAVSQALRRAQCEVRGWRVCGFRTRRAVRCEPEGWRIVGCAANRSEHRCTLQPRMMPAAAGTVPAAASILNRSSAAQAAGVRLHRS
jgi:hypothetical protein